MLTPEVFEELLASYPAEKRELARQAYYRFADGDSGEFFTQLFLVLDVYAHYAERVPEAVIAANQSAHANLAKLRDEINLLAQGMDRRNLNITNHADQLSHDAIAACNDASGRLEALVKNIGAQVNAQAIVDGIHTELEKGIQGEIIAPFIQHSQELAKGVIPTLEEIKEASTEAKRLWSCHIWRTAWATTSAVMLGLLVLLAAGIYHQFKNYFEHGLAEKIANVERRINYNRDAFRQLAIAQVPVKVVRTEDNGVLNPRGFALIIENADGAVMRPIDGNTNGIIFFSSNLSEEMIQRIQSELEKATQKLKEPAK
jgi:hypothetical protein